MTTLIAVYNSDGCVGRCNAKCYNAKHSLCICICNGKNHGAGQDKAFKNTREYQEKWIEQFSLEKQLKEFTSQVNPDVFQFSLFE